MNIQLSVLFFLSSIVVFAQKHILILKSKHASFFKEIKEDRRIEIETKEGKTFLGRFKVQDSTALVINEEVVLLADIIKIKKKSKFGTIANPIFVTIGVGLFIAGASGLFVANPFAAMAGIITMIGSIPIIVVPLFMYGYPSKKWEYSIKEIQ